MSEPSPQPGPPPAGWMPPPLSGTAGWPAQQASWAPPVPAQQVGFAPGPPGRPGKPWTVVAIVVGALVLVGAAVAVWALWGSLGPAPTSSTGPVPTAPVEVAGGDIGAAVTLEGPDGAARVTTSAARWTPEGDLPPVEGSSYLVLDVQLEGISGQVAVGGVFTVAVTADGERHGIAYGPRLDPLLPSTVLRPDRTVAGQLGYQLPPGEVTVEFQTPGGDRLGTVRIPGP